MLTAYCAPIFCSVAILPVCPYAFIVPALLELIIVSASNGSAPLSMLLWRLELLSILNPD